MSLFDDNEIAPFRDENGLFDGYMYEIIHWNVNMSIPWFLMAAYGYYEVDDNILSDAAYDALAKFIVKEWNHIEHRHKHLIDVESLKKTSSIFDVVYPGMVKGAYKELKKITVVKSK